MNKKKQCTSSVSKYEERRNYRMSKERKKEIVRDNGNNAQKAIKYKRIEK